MQNWWQINLKYKALCASESLRKLVYHNLPVLVRCTADVFCCVVIVTTPPDQLQQGKRNSLERPPQTEVKR